MDEKLRGGEVTLAGGYGLSYGSGLITEEEDQFYSSEEDLESGRGEPTSAYDPNCPMRCDHGIDRTGARPYYCNCMYAKSPEPLEGSPG